MIGPEGMADKAEVCPYVLLKVTDLITGVEEMIGGDADAPLSGEDPVGQTGMTGEAGMPQI